MSSLKKIYYENALRMRSGEVGGLVNRDLHSIFEDFNIDITSEKYTQEGTSKANKLRAFWKLESNPTTMDEVMLMICEATQTKTYEENKIKEGDVSDKTLNTRTINKIQ